MSKNHRQMNQKRWLAVRRLVLNRDKFRCAKCGLHNGRLEVHHKISLKHGGEKYEPENLQTLCKKCHLKLSVFGPRLEWVEHLTELARRLKTT